MAKQREPLNSPGIVYLVGAGPGDPGLITWRGVECLRQADLVLYDYLVNPAILRHAAANAELICLGRHRRDESESDKSAKPAGGNKLWTQQEINARMIQSASAGKKVVRLKGGDPAIFGRLAEELAALEGAKIEFEIVPGVTAALAAGSHAGICLTDRDRASAVAIVTGREGDSPEALNLDYQALAKFPGTLVFYMGLTTARQWTAELIAAGKSKSTPVAIVRRCSWPDQSTIRCTLETVVESLEAAKMRPPVIVIVGEVVDQPQVDSWFTKRPLFGVTVLLTRPIDRTDSLWQPLVELGANCLAQPAIEIAPPESWQPVDAAIGRLSEFDWLVFSSVNGVQYFLDRLFATGGDLRQLAGVKLAAIGPGTADALAKYHLRVDGQPAEVYRAEALAEFLAKNATGKRFLLARASRGREVLAETLRAAGAIIEQVVVYNSTDVATPNAEVSAALKAGRIDWITVTSSAIARSIVRLFGDDLHKTKIVSISPITSATLREQGFEPAAEAKVYTMQGVVNAILSAI